MAFLILIFNKIIVSQLTINSIQLELGAHVLRIALYSLSLLPISIFQPVRPNIISKV